MLRHFALSIFRMLFLHKRLLFLCLVCANTYFLFAQKLTRGPYLQIGTPTSVVVKWRTDAATYTKVFYGTTSNSKTQMVKNDAVVTEHEITITGLQPNTVYYYGIDNNGEIKEGADYYFKTAPLPGSKQKIKIWAMGDMGDGSPNQRSVRDAYLNSIKNDNTQTDVVLLLGDNAYAIGTDEEYQYNFFNIYQDYFLKNNVLWAVPGNHEYYSGAQNRRDVSYFQIFSLPTKAEAGGVVSGSEMYYSFDYANVHFVALDSYGIEEDRYRLYDTLSPQVEWLKKDLITNKQPWTIVMFHHPPYTRNSHDSDYEEQLKLIRQNLNPILERFKVDLVLSGHSHLYERSRPMRGHTGLSDTFRDDLHLTSLSSGRYDGGENACAYVKNGGDEGVIYVVAGSSGQNNGFNGIAHPAMPFKNSINGGSVVIEVEDNRLDFNWLCNDRIVRDQFTIFKNVPKTVRLKAQHGEKVVLRPDWKGAYRWSDGSKAPTFDFRLLQDTVITVKDELGCLEQKFMVNIALKPSIKTRTPQAVCEGQNLNVSYLVENTDSRQWQYRVQLSDDKGSFGKPTFLENIGEQNAELRVAIPKGIPQSADYKIRVIANVGGFEYTPSDAFAIKQKATATLSGDTTIEAGKSAELKLSFTGTPPWTYKLSGGPTATTTTNPLLISVTPQITALYELETFANACGNGGYQGKAQVVVVPKITSTLSVNQVLCDETTAFLNFQVAGTLPHNTRFVAQLSDANGSFNTPKNLGSGIESPLKIVVPKEVEFGGNYQLRTVPDQVSVYNVAPTGVFSIKQRAKASISGDTIVQLGEKAMLKLSFQGQAPWTYKLSDSTSATTTERFVSLPVSPDLATTYTLKSVTNICGIGTVSGSARVNVVVTSAMPQETQIKVYPNPAQNRIFIEVEATQNKTLDWELWNVEAKVIKQGSLRRSQRNQAEVDIHSLPAGVYLLKMVFAGATIERKIIKL